MMLQTRSYISGPRVCVLLAITWGALSNVAAEDTLRVMSFNLWHGGDAGGQPLSQTIRAIRDAKADIVGLQETHGREMDGVRPDNGRKIADKLGWDYIQQGDRTGILSRYRIRSVSANRWGVEIEYAPEKRLYFFNAHFPSAPYQPYQLLKIPYGEGVFIATEREAIREANAARGAAALRLVSEMTNAIMGNHPVIATGDFNEPSHQDWTKAATDAKLCPIKVRFPTTLQITTAGLIDAWRFAHPNEVTERGLTWTPTTKPGDPKDRHDRIDFVFVSPSRLKVVDCQVVGEDDATSDIVVSPWPSDHRAVVAELVVLGN